MSENGQNNEHFITPEEEERLREALLKAIAVPYIPESCDRAVLAMIERKAVEIKEARKKGRLVRFVAWAGACAAALLLVLSLSMPSGEQPSHEKIAISQRPDIVDAYMLAYRLKTARAVSLKDDFNKDGSIDEKDVEGMAQTAVSVLSH